MALASAKLREQMNLESFTGDPMTLMQLLQEKKWCAEGNNALNRLKVKRYGKEKIVDSVVSSLAEAVICEINPQQAVIARMQRKRSQT